MTKSEFVSGVQKQLHLWMTESDVVEVFEDLRFEGETIDSAEFKRIIQDFLNLYNVNVKDDKYVVTKSQFLNAIVDISNGMQHRDAAKAVSYFVTNAGGLTVTGDKAVDMASELDPRLPEWKLNSIRREGEEVDKVGFARLMLKYCVARYGVGLFYLSEFDSELTAGVTTKKDQRF